MGGFIVIVTAFPVRVVVIVAVAVALVSDSVGSGEFL